MPKPGTPSRNVDRLSGVDSRYVAGSRGIPSTDGQLTGVALGDVNGDGWLDLAQVHVQHFRGHRVVAMHPVVLRGE